LWGKRPGLWIWISPYCTRRPQFADRRYPPRRRDLAVACFIFCGSHSCLHKKVSENAQARFEEACHQVCQPRLSEQASSPEVKPQLCGWGGVSGFGKRATTVTCQRVKSRAMDYQPYRKSNRGLDEGKYSRNMYGHS
jgi:hypothetical protein